MGIKLVSLEGLSRQKGDLAHQNLHSKGVDGSWRPPYKLVMMIKSSEAASYDGFGINKSRDFLANTYHLYSNDSILVKNNAEGAVKDRVDPDFSSGIKFKNH